ncbi:autophagy protein Apg6-domain-containing protein [Endogone sp. FLAS-F59071]|nr:autophagy protein Apg6-domain-containing protein [Endogone sp. FLAS-F59071]|eukprot:RUS21347.1 autophagy protein Apg6-domain-containing protein [Endogone sp. FLAS-F59071]
MLEHDHPHLSMLVCQRCKQPLRVDDSLTDLDPSNADRLVAPLLTEDRAQTAKIPHRQVSTSQQTSKTLDPVSRRVIPSPTAHPSSSSSHPRSAHSLPPGPAESYIMLTRSQIGSPTTTPSSSDHTTAASNGPAPSSSSEDNQQRNNHSLSHHLKVANRLFDIMSARSDIDHPMCQECTDMLLDSLSRQLADVSRERDCYIDFLKKVNSGIISDEEQEDLKKDIAEITAAEQAAIESLRETERQRDALKEELYALEEESKELDALEESYWQDFNAFQIKLQTFHNERDSVNLKYDHDARQLERLQKTNVYKDTFCISHEGHFGTINGFRLGRLPNQPV